MKVRTNFLIAMLVVLIAGVTLSTYWMYYFSSKRATSQAIESNIDLSNILHEAVYVFMRTGHQSDLEAYLKKAREFPSVSEITVIRSAVLEKEKGVKKDKHPQDDLEEKVLGSGQRIVQEVTVQGKRAIRSISPVHANASCLPCHPDFREGDVMAVLSTTLVYQSSLDAVKRQLIVNGFVQGLIIVIAVGVIFLFIDRFIINPVVRIGDAVHKFGKGDWTAIADLQSWCGKKPFFFRKKEAPQKSLDEVGELAVAFNDMVLDLREVTVSRDELVKEIIQRKQAEKALRESQELLQGIMNTISVRVFWKDKNLTYLGCNTTFAQDAGFADPKDVIGKDDYQMAWRGQAELYRADDRQVIKSGHPKLLIEEPQTTAKGDNLTLLTNKIPLRNAEGEIIGVLGTYMDITERKNAEVIAQHELGIRKMVGRLLKLSLEENSLEDYLRQALDLILEIPWFSLESKGSIFLVEEDPTMLVMKVQRGLSDSLQKSCGFLPFGKCHCGKAAAKKKIEFASTVTERHEIHYQGMVPHGHYCVPILFGGKVIGVLNTYVKENYKNDEWTEHFLRMITDALAGAIEKKRAEEALRKAHDELELRVRERTAELAESRAYIEKILATITDYIYTVTVRDGAAIEVAQQPGCLSVTGYTAEEFKDRPDLWEKIVHEEDRPKVHAFSAELLAGKNTGQVEYRIWHKDGRMRWVRNVPVLHFDLSGRLTSFDGIISDITEKKQAEILLNQSMEKLALANKAKDQFLANMSHEVRTPLNAIIGFSCLLESTNLDPAQKEYVTKLRDGGEIMLSLVTDVIDFSRITTGEVRLEKIHFDLRPMIQGILETVIKKLNKKDLKVFCTFDEKVPNGFRGDPTRLRRILGQLVNNAVKFTETGEVEVRVTLDGETEKKDPECVKVRIAVRDTGIGIPKDKHEKIFEAFEQVDISTTRKYGGAGLGLSISKTLANLMGGTIEVQSEPGKGSTFSLVLSLEVEPAMEKVEIFPLKDDELVGKKILILDDEEMARNIFTRYSEEAKMVVSHSTLSAQDALKWLSEQPVLPDIFLADILLPDVDGYEVGRKLRGDKKYEGMKLVAVSGDMREGVASRVRQSGFDAYLAKPVSRENFMKVIKIVLGDKRKKTRPAEIVTRYTAEELANKGLKVLVVEDNPASQELLSIILRSFEFDVEIASDGREAVEKVRKDPYDLVLMDLQMPIMGGVEATEIIRKELHKTMPILALTAGISDDDREKCLAAGMNDYLMKPIEIPKLKDKVSQWIRGVPQNEPGRRPAGQEVENVAEGWDKQRALKELGIPEGLYHELVLGFIEQSAAAIQNLEKAFQERNFEEVAKAAHFIKGAAGNLRVGEVYATAKMLEAVAKGDQNTAVIEKQMGSLKNAIEELKKNI